MFNYKQGNNPNKERDVESEGTAEASAVTVNKNSVHRFNNTQKLNGLNQMSNFKGLDPSIMNLGATNNNSNGSDTNQNLEIFSD